MLVVSEVFYLFWPDFIESFDKFVVDHECNGNISANTTETRNRSFVEAERKGLVFFSLFSIELTLRVLHDEEFVLHNRMYFYILMLQDFAFAF